eukprot:CAMPEP_0196138422 /NCGR_PEP_ID=MMETSP0910-20130528/6070_1 /TAXON_ID=49265 /ORGANISM="Thalassiosira rotula, Strain GSO102" /LENGTH=197 /DNA_ID=CAMNT_0041399027 /DNA_START=55 /DNA_END=645 /DNA_ORIENTATION=+
MSAIPTRTEDVMSGGGTFSSCLDRSIRHPVSLVPGPPPGAPATNDAPNTPGGRTSLADAISRSTSSDAANQDSNDNNSTYIAVTSQTTAPMAESNNDKYDIDNNMNNNNNDNELTDRGENWTSHHISYPLLRSTLTFFSMRRARLRTVLRDTLSNEPVIMNANVCGDRGSLKPELSEEEFNLAVNEYAVHAPFLKKA